MNTSPIETTAVHKFWYLIHSLLREFWSITERSIEDAAVRNNVPIELYYYSELGLDYFSIEEFQQRDPFSNPEQFERLFARLEVKGWIVPIRDEGRYKVSNKARRAVTQIIQTGDEQLAGFKPAAELDLERLLAFLKQIVLANSSAAEPPTKWAIVKRFRTTDEDSPVITQIRECLMDLFAYHDDAHLAAARPHFNQAGIVWSVLGSVATGSAITAEQMAETLSFHGYEIEDYEVAIQAAVEIGWLETANTPNNFRPTQTGRELREKVEKLTDEYFYRPWATFPPAELDEFHNLLIKLREQLIKYKKESGVGRLAA